MSSSERALWLAEKACQKYGVKAVTPSVNHTMCWFSRPKFRISGLKIHRSKIQMERESSGAIWWAPRKFKWRFSFLFLWTKEKLLFTKSSFKEFNYGFFTAESWAKMCPVLKFNQGSHSFEGFPGTIFPLLSRKLH